MQWLPYFFKSKKKTAIEPPSTHPDNTVDDPDTRRTMEKYWVLASPARQSLSIVSLIPSKKILKVTYAWACMDV